ncbi:MAG: hypothetical protein HGB12_06100 [Bacteroidetes bacterium]|nr:hypothetical protein [Bacteroidota bacterium]
MTKKRKLHIAGFIIFALLIINHQLLITNSIAQSGGAAFNINGNAADNSAILDVSSTAQGMLIPRMTTIQRDSIAIKCSCVPASGLLVFNTTTNCFEVYNGTWQSLSCTCTNAPLPAGSISGASTVCPGQNAVLYSVPVIGRATSYTWSYSASGATIVGSSNAVIIYFSETATSGNLTVMGTNPCGNGTVSNNHAIAVNSISPDIIVQPVSAASCPGSEVVSFTVTATGGLSYQWQEYTSSWNNVANAGVYSNVTTATLTITNPPAGMDGYKYRCIVSGTCTNNTSDGLATLRVNPEPYTVGGVTTTTTCDGTHTVVSFTCSGSATGSTTWTVPSGVTTVECLVVAGGGGGGGNNSGGGGGAGGLSYNSSLSIIAGSYTVTVGGGGAGVTSGVGESGGSSSLGTLMTAPGGGGGANYDINGGNGGSGGGTSQAGASGGTFVPGTAGAGGVTRGNSGGLGITGNPYGGGGGGGAGSAGTNANSSSKIAGNGGAGYSYSITGSSVCYAGGGGGTINDPSGNAVSGGSGGTATCGGGNGENGPGFSTNGTPNTGGGGGGSTGWTIGKNGGSGIVIIRYSN